MKESKATQPLHASVVAVDNSGTIDRKFGVVARQPYSSSTPILLKKLFSITCFDAIFNHKFERLKWGFWGWTVMRLLNLSQQGPSEDLPQMAGEMSFCSCGHLYILQAYFSKGLNINLLGENKR